jgi:UDP-N-acetyl-2-amino-2-deoxyglucuronate dehydrogenase
MTAAKTFGLIGAAGYVAPRHLKAIADTGGVLEAAFDPADSVGILDRYFPKARFFSEFERFDRHVDLLRRKGTPLGYISICSPNYLHDAHIRFALRSGADAICEKPLVLNPWNVDALTSLEAETGRKVNAILQLRLHEAFKTLRGTVNGEAAGKKHDVTLTYVTARGGWYYVSWKGNESKSGGVATNIGIHFYDVLSFVFGPMISNEVHHRAIDCAAGLIEYERARVRWFLSINARDLPREVVGERTTFREIAIDGEPIEFSEGFAELHTESYREILAGRGYGVADARPAIEIASEIRTKPLTGNPTDCHPFLEKVLNDGARYQFGWPV